MRLKPSSPRLRQDHPLAYGLLLAIPFVEGSGGPGDVSGSNRSVTLLGDPAWQPGNAGWAISLDGTNDYIEVAGTNANFFMGVQHYTFSLWINSSSTASTTDPAIVSIGRAINPIGLSARTSGTQLTHRRAGANSGTLTIDYLNKWTHLVGTFNGAAIQTYANGVLVNSTATTASLSSASPVNWAFGSNSSRNLFSGMLISDARIYSRALSADEVRTSYENPWDIYRPRQRSYFYAGISAGGPTYTLTADAGSFALTGIDAGLQASRLLTADAGSFATTGIDAGIVASRMIAADAGQFVLTGIDADLTYSGAVGPTYTLSCDGGSFAFSGVDAGLFTSRIIQADLGSFELTGIAANLTYSGAAASIPSPYYYLLGQ